MTNREIKYTPGPWLSENNTVYALHIREIGGKEMAVNRFYAGVYIDYGAGIKESEKQANVKLIAAAPDLLEAAKEAIDYLGYNIKDLACGESNIREACELLAAAIEKATGAEKGGEPK